MNLGIEAVTEINEAKRRSGILDEIRVISDGDMTLGRLADAMNLDMQPTKALERWLSHIKRVRTSKWQ